MEEKEIIGKIKYKENEKEFKFPKDFNIFKEKLKKILTQDFLNNTILLYKDENGDNQEIKNEEDYAIFFDDIKITNNLVLQLKEGQPFHKIKKESNNISNENNNINNNINNVNNSNNMRSIDNNNNNIQKSLKENNINNKIKRKFCVPFTCNRCQHFSYSEIIYYCKECNFVVCSNCESQNYSKQHFHCYYKIQNKKQYNKINIGEIIKLNEYMLNWGDKILDKTYEELKKKKKVIGFNPYQEAKNKNKEMEKYILNLIQKFRNIKPEKTKALTDDEIVIILKEYNLI